MAVLVRRRMKGEVLWSDVLGREQCLEVIYHESDEETLGFLFFP